MLFFTQLPQENNFALFLKLLLFWSVSSYDGWSQILKELSTKTLIHTYVFSIQIIMKKNANRNKVEILLHGIQMNGSEIFFCIK